VERLELPDRGDDWVVAADGADHAAEGLAVVPQELIDSLPPALDVAGGW
jgi:hypothetical protein